MISSKFGLILIPFLLSSVNGFNSCQHSTDSSLLCNKYETFSASRTTTIATTKRNTSKIMSNLYMKSGSSATSFSEIATLTDMTTWKLRFVMNGITTAKGRKTDELFVIQAKFLEDEGYEPPQGIVSQVVKKVDTDTDIDDDNENKDKKPNGLQLVSGRWQLSEDPDDRKDGLWVWGLFKEPLYPFLLLSLKTERIVLPGSEADSIPPLDLYAQISHVRDKDTGNVELKASVINIRETETVKADVFGTATVDVYEEISVGQLSIQPMP